MWLLKIKGIVFFDFNQALVLTTGGRWVPLILIGDMITRSGGGCGKS